MGHQLCGKMEEGRGRGRGRGKRENGGEGKKWRRESDGRRESDERRERERIMSVSVISCVSEDVPFSLLENFTK